MRYSIWITVLVLTAGCGASRVQPWEYSPRPMADTLSIWQPEERVVPLLYDAAHQFFIRPISGGEGGGEALNTDRMDAVVNSTWFTNRNAVASLSPAAVARGPKTSDGPDTSGPITVTSIKAEGITPGFNIKDARGDRYIVKFDPPEYPELASGAEVIATSLFWASGYNTPENYILNLDPSSLVLDDDLVASWPDEDGVMVEYSIGAEDPAHELTVAVLQRNILDKYPRHTDGTVRALASRFLEGTPIGPFDFQGIRDDDPNDVVPHQHRRELRGLYVIDAWLNQTDAKQGNTLDMFVPAPGSRGDRRYGYVRHNLIDFGSALGSAAIRPHGPRHGSENEFDLSAIGKRFLSLGFYRRPWQTVDDTLSPRAAGFYALPAFEPGDWRPNMPNPAFDNVTPADGYWGAKIVMSFTDEQLAAAAETAHYTDGAATRYVLDGLKARRDATGRYWFSQVAPLDNPRIEDGSLFFDDLYIRHFGGSAQYRYELDWDAPDPDVRVEDILSVQRVSLPTFPGSMPETRREEDRLARVRVWKVLDDGTRVRRPATFWLEWAPTSAGYGWHLVGVRY